VNFLIIGGAILTSSTGVPCCWPELIATLEERGGYIAETREDAGRAGSWRVWRANNRGHYAEFRAQGLR
jgi:hypothetical protein